MVCSQILLYPVDNPVVAVLVEDILNRIGELVARHLEIVGALIAPLDNARVNAISGSTSRTLTEKITITSRRQV